MFAESLDDKRVLASLSSDEERVLFISNASRDRLTDEVKKELGTKSIELGFLPKIRTNLCQAADNFIIGKILTVWRKCVINWKRNWFPVGSGPTEKIDRENIQTLAKRFLSSLPLTS